MISVSRVGPVIAAVAVSVLLVSGPAYAQTSDLPTPGGGTASTCPPDSTSSQATAASDTTACAPTGTPNTSTDTSGNSTTSSTANSTSSTAGSSTTSTQTGGTVGTGAGGTAQGIAPGGNGGSTSTGAGQAGAPGNGGTPPPAAAKRKAGDKNCPDFATQPDAQRYFESIGGSPTHNADRLDENHNGIACEDFFDDGDDQSDVTATGDDGSRATTSGKQVTEVPEGSAQTGGN